MTKQTGQSLEAQIDEILLKFAEGVSDVVRETYFDKAKSALITLVDKYVEERELLAVIDELRYFPITRSYRAYIEKRLVTLRQQVKDDWYKGDGDYTFVKGDE